MELLLVKPKIKSLKYDDVNLEEIFEISPLEGGLARGVFGNSLRTVLLALIPGYAVTNFRLEYREGDGEFINKPHIFDTIPGVITDMTDISMNIKESCFRLIDETEREITVTKKGPCTLTLKDFAADGVEILNPDLKILRIMNDTEVKLTLKIQEGRGYKDESFYDADDYISLDASFSPVLFVKPEIEAIRVNGVGGYEKLTLTIKTNGKLTPKEALDIAIRIILEGYMVFGKGTQDVIDNESIYFDVQEEENKPVVFCPLDELGLSVRAYNALKSYGINTTEDFKRYTKKEIREIKNLGKKTYEEIEKKLVELNIELKK